MKIFGIDPGTTQSAWVLYELNENRLVEFGVDNNRKVLGEIYWCADVGMADHLVIEQIKSYGMVIGDSLLETCLWSGRFIEAWCSLALESRSWLLPRKSVVTQICGDPRGKDKNVRQALLDRFGGREKAIGTKACPGPLFGVKRDIWASLALVLAWAELNPPQGKAP